MNALGVSQYGQMTAGSYMYIGPQGLVHGTTITILNAARKYLDLQDQSDLGGILYVTSGLGVCLEHRLKRLSSAGAVCIIAEIDPIAANKQHQQGWLTELYDDLEKVISRSKQAVEKKEAISIGYLEHSGPTGISCSTEYHTDLASDQTSLHNPWLGGYMPVGISFEDGREMIINDPDGFKNEVQKTLRKHVEYVNQLTDRGTIFWDYGNAFLLESSRAGAEVVESDGSFRYPSYVENIMGPMCFDYGFGPFRWVCTSGSDEDLRISDKIASEILSL